MSVASLHAVEFRRSQTAATAPASWSAEFFSNLLSLRTIVVRLASLLLLLPFLIVLLFYFPALLFLLLLELLVFLLLTLVFSRLLRLLQFLLVLLFEALTLLIVLLLYSLTLLLLLALQLRITRVLRRPIRSAWADIFILRPVFAWIAWGLRLVRLRGGWQALLSQIRRLSFVRSCRGRPIRAIRADIFILRPVFAWITRRPRFVRLRRGWLALFSWTGRLSLVWLC